MLTMTRGILSSEPTGMTTWREHVVYVNAQDGTKPFRPCDLPDRASGAEIRTASL